MVRSESSLTTMDNQEEILDALNDFEKKPTKEIPALLDQFLHQVAKTGETLFPWPRLKPLLISKLDQVMAQFNQEIAVEHFPVCPNVENVRFDEMRGRILGAVDRFHGAPFTIQRLCELITDPKRHYKRSDKFLRGIEKNVLVVSTVDPFGRKIVSESRNLVNGLDTNGCLPSRSENQNSFPTPPVPLWTGNTPVTTWPTQTAGEVVSASQSEDDSHNHSQNGHQNGSKDTLTDTAPNVSQSSGADAQLKMETNQENTVDKPQEITASSPPKEAVPDGSGDKSREVTQSTVGTDSEEKSTPEKEMSVTKEDLVKEVVSESTPEKDTGEICGPAAVESRPTVEESRPTSTDCEVQKVKTESENVSDSQKSSEEVCVSSSESASVQCEQARQQTHTDKTDSNTESEHRVESAPVTDSRDSETTSEQIDSTSSVERSSESVDSSSGLMETDSVESTSLSDSQSEKQENKPASAPESNLQSEEPMEQD